MSLDGLDRKSYMALASPPITMIHRQLAGI